MIMIKESKSFIVLLLFFCIFLFVNVSEATSQDLVDFGSDSDLIAFANFGFLEGGHFTITVVINSIIKPNNNKTYPTPDFQVYGCDGKEFYHNSDFNDVCVYDPKCSLTYVLHPGPNYITGTIERQGYYYFLLSNCNGQYIDYSFSYSLTNPTSNHLSYELMPLPIILMVFVALWSILILYWVFNWFTHRTQKITLHKIITLYPVSKLIDVIYSLGYYQYFKVHGATSVATIIVYWIIFIIFRIISIVVLLLIAAGYAILPVPISKSYKHTIHVTIVMLAITLGLGSFLGGYYNILSFIVYIPILAVLFMKSDRNIYLIRVSIAQTLRKEQLQNQQAQNEQVQPIEVVNNGDGNNTQPPQQVQLELQVPEIDALPIGKRYALLHMFIAFKWIMVVFIGCTIILQFMAVVFPYGWVFDFFTYIIEISLFICLALTFRLRPEKKDSYYLFDEDVELNDVN